MKVGKLAWWSVTAPKDFFIPYLKGYSPATLDDAVIFSFWNFDVICRVTFYHYRLFHECHKNSKTNQHGSQWISNETDRWMGIKE